MKQFIIGALICTASFILGGTAMWTYHHPERLSGTGVADGEEAMVADAAAGGATNQGHHDQHAGNSTGSAAGRSAQQSGMPLSGGRLVDPFADMARMHREMEAFWSTAMGSPVGGMFSRQGVGMPGMTPGAGALDMQEDADSINYLLRVPRENLVDVNVNLEDGYVSIDATLKQQSDVAVSESRISRRFPVPGIADTGSMKVDTTDQGVLIHFDKLQA